MRPTITAFKSSPDRGRGLARDMRVRWALEEVGQAYDVRLLTFAEMKQPAHLALHPFGQIPTYEEGDLALFESGSIVFHIAQTRPGLLPDDANGRARAVTWMFSALSTVEPPILDRFVAVVLEGDKPWAEQRLPLVEDRIRARLGQLSTRLGEDDWLDGGFSAGDLMMVSVLLRLGSSGLLDEYPNLAAYVARGEARPAYKRAFAAQLAVFNAARAAEGDRTMSKAMSRRTLFALAAGASATTALAPDAASARAPLSKGAKNEMLVRKWFKLWEDEKTNWAPYEAMLADDFTFTSAAPDDHISRAAFKKRCWETQIGAIGRFDLELVMAKGDLVVVKYLGRTKSGKAFRNVELHQLRGRQIASIECYFGGPAGYPTAAERQKS
jgi:glutathione S-transferase